MEKRAAKRWRARLRRAKLFDSSHRFLVECRVLDVSSNGARLRPESDRPLPLELHYREDDSEPFTPAALAWIKRREIGIRFLDEAKTPGQASPADDAAELRNAAPSA